ncbi:MAG: replication restart helicase PriA, partial [bacterium]
DIDRPMADLFAAVALNLAVDQTFTYRVPGGLRDEVVPGRRVRVPFRGRPVVGYCVALAETTELDRVLDVESVLDEGPLISAEMLDLTRWIADYYCCAWGQALEAALPGGVRRDIRHRMQTVVRLAVPRADVPDHVEELEARAGKQARALDVLASLEHRATVQELAGLADCSASTVRALARTGLIELSREEVDDDPLLSAEPTEAEAVPPRLEPAQDAALKRILSLRRRKESGVVLMHGVTGSGKTEVYLQAIARVVAEGGGAIVLVPEISLTPQTVRRFRARFDRVAVLHSHLTEAQRHEQWRAIRSGDVQVVVGARSAVFAPMPDLGLIVVDEEDGTSFKQDQVPRYHARDVAVVRGRTAGAVVVLGSATPALESYRNAKRGKYELARLPGRVLGRPMPDVELVDMRAESSRPGGSRFLSHRLLTLIEDRLSRDEQAIVFLNRRGFSTYVFCTRCGWSLTCAHCDISMTYHRGADRAVCHHCGLRARVPARCPECRSDTVKSIGLGTEKVEAELVERFPDVPCARMDSDSVRGRGAHRRVLDAFRAGRARILVGTQMIAKGLDFPGVTLVGVVNADTALHLPDFRAGERTHQLVSQVAGRTGRGPKGGLVVIQTWQPEHYTMRTAAAHDYATFAETELEHRRQLGFPPFTRAARIVIDGKRLGDVKQAAHDVARAMTAQRERTGGVVHGPMPCPIERIKDRHRWHILVLGGKSSVVRAMIAAARPAFPTGRRVRVAVDVDPVSML